MITFAESLRALQKMHAWTRAFFGAHCFKLNPSKTVFTSSKRPPSSFRLSSVSGKAWVTWCDASTAFRYLGVKINIDLDWSAELDAVADDGGAEVRHDLRKAIKLRGPIKIDIYLHPQVSESS